MATGGVYIAGGIAPRLADALVKGAFMAAFRNKAPMAELVARMPVMLVKNAEVGLYGAALAAAQET
jgi:glucokinase